MRSYLAACRRRVGGLDGVIPPIGGDEVAAWGGAAPKTQTTSVKYAENGVLWARWSVFWAQRHWYGLLRVCGSLNMRVVPLIRT